MRSAAISGCVKLVIVQLACVCIDVAGVFCIHKQLHNSCDWTRLSQFCCVLLSVTKHAETVITTLMLSVQSCQARMSMVCSFVQCST